MVPPRILIVDNDLTVCWALKRLLEAHGAALAVTATSAEDAEVEIFRGPVDLMILDYHLPGMRGDAFFHRACTVQPTLATRTLFITGDPSPQARAALQATGQPMLLKPFLVSEMVEQLRTMGGERSTREVRSA